MCRRKASQKGKKRVYRRVIPKLLEEDLFKSLNFFDRALQSDKSDKEMTESPKRNVERKDSRQKVGDEKTLTHEQFRRVDPSNRIKTTRYNVFNFVPITLFI